MARINSLFAGNKAKLYVVAGGILALLLSVLFVPIFLILYSVVVAYLCLKLPKKINIVSIRCLFVIITIAAAYTILGNLFLAFGLWVNPLVYALLVAIVCFVIFIIRKDQQELPKLKIGDLIIVVPAVVTVMGLVAGLYIQERNLEYSVIKTTTRAIDETEHIASFIDLVRSDSNLLEGDARVKQRIHISAGNPEGWHLVASIITNSVVDIKDEVMQKFINIYYVAKMMTVFVIVACIGALVYALSAYLEFKRKSAFMLMIITLVTTIFVVLPSVVISGHTSFLSAFIFLPLTAIIALMFEEKEYFTQNVCILLFLTAGLAASWTLLAAVPGIFLVANVILMLSKRKIKWKDVFRPAIIISAVAAGAAFLSQQFIILTLDRSHGAGESSLLEKVLADGGTVYYGFLFSCIIIAALIAFLFFYKKTAERLAGLRVLTLVSLWLSLALIGIFVLNLITPRYYFMKFDNGVMAIFLPVVLVSSLYALQSKIVDKTKACLLFIPIIVMFCLSGIVNYRQFFIDMPKAITHPMQPEGINLKLYELMSTQKFGESDKFYYFVYNHPVCGVFCDVPTNYASIVYHRPFGSFQHEIYKRLWDTTDTQFQPGDLYRFVSELNDPRVIFVTSSARAEYLQANYPNISVEVVDFGHY